MTFQKHVDLTPLNTFGISAAAKVFTTIRSLSDAEILITTDTFRNQKTLLLGGGSNILLTKDFDGLVIKVDIKGKQILEEDESTLLLKVGAGENWHELVLYCVERDWGGVENLSLIPGTMGAAPMQNIGAYGVELKDVIENVEALEISSGELKNFSNEACHFGYRDSIFKQQAKDRYIISSVTLRLTKKNHKRNVSYGAIQEILTHLGGEPSVKAISDAVIHIRRSKLPDPALIGNAGSFFKNPSIDLAIHTSIKKEYIGIPGYPTDDGMMKVPAAWLIEQCGWKGKTFNQVGVHQHQALVLVNYGGGEGEKIWELAMNIQRSVKEKFNIVLQPEVNVI